MSASAPPSKARLFSGMQPTHDSLHLGNYLGALVNWVAMQEQFEAIYAVVDLHAITVEFDPAVLRQRTRVTAAQYLAAGVDPDRTIVFVQSHVTAHAELAWVLASITSTGEASRMTQFKDKAARQGAERASVGLFTYPILMAADILLYDAAKVPVGEDQRQHLELTRDLAQRFNKRFGRVFVVPEPHITGPSAKIMDLQNPVAKMSKTAPAGSVDLLADPRVIAKRVRSAVTDAGHDIRFDEQDKPGISNLLTIFAALTGRTMADLEGEYAGRGYGDFKRDLAEVLVEVATPMRARVTELLEDPGELDGILADGADRARPIAEATLRRVYDAVGFLPGRR